MLGAAVGMLGFVLTSPALVRAQSSDVPPDVKTNDDGPGKPEWSGAFTPPDPIPGGWDWFRMSSGEWIKGEIVLMRNFEFDSDEFQNVSYWLTPTVGMGYYLLGVRT